MHEHCYIKCEVGRGMFPDEYVANIQAVTPEGGTLVASTIVSKESIRIRKQPTAGTRVAGQLRVYCVKKKGDFVAVVLPQATMENGSSIIVRRDAVVKKG